MPRGMATHTKLPIKEYGLGETHSQIRNCRWETGGTSKWQITIRLKDINQMTTLKQHIEIAELDAWQRSNYFKAIELGVTHKEAILLATNIKLKVQEED